MNQEIIPIRLLFVFDIYLVNCYLVKTDSEFFLIDAGFTTNRKALENELKRLGCLPGNLKLILLTHGDFDHIGNAVYLRGKYGAKIAMHNGDAGMLENGDMFYRRKFENRLLRSLMKIALPFSAKNWGKPDILVEDGQSLAQYGLDAIAYNTPGHSTGSICLLTSQGDLFCGDLLTNSHLQPQLNSMLYDHPAGQASLERLKTLSIKMVYPGHGKPFRWEDLVG